MRSNPTKIIEAYRVTEGLLASSSEIGANGAFCIPYNHVILNVIASDGTAWDGPEEAFEHVSVSLPVRCPTWEEMDFIKRIFWRDDECVMQLHVPRDSHINQHPFCLHLWKPTKTPIPLPAKVCV